MKNKALTPFEQALLDANLEQFQNIPPENEIDLELSPDFLATGEKMIRDVERKGTLRRRTFVRAAALIAAVLLLSACGVPAIRKAFVDFFIKDVGTHYTFQYDPNLIADAPEEIETIFAPTKLPEDFVLEVEDISVAGVALMWRNAEDVWINYFQEVYPELPNLGDSGGFNSEGANAEWVQLEGCKILRIEDDEWIHYAWASSEYRFSISCSDKSYEDALKKAFSSIQVDTTRSVNGTD